MILTAILVGMANIFHYYCWLQVNQGALFGVLVDAQLTSQFLKPTIAMKPIAQSGQHFPS